MFQIKKSSEDDITVFAVQTTLQWQLLVIEMDLHAHALEHNLNYYTVGIQI